MSTATEGRAACPACGYPVQPGVDTGGLCPRCLLQAALAQLTTDDHPGLSGGQTFGPTPRIDDLNQRLPQLEFDELLGRGGAGWVFRARQRSLDRAVAVKLLHAHSAGRPDAVARFKREAQVLARLNHPRIVTIYDFGAEGDAPYLVMEYVAGPTLREALGAGPLEAAAVARIMDQICDAVHYAHESGVLHCDLKPENVLFESPGDGAALKVADFGIARLLADADSSHAAATERLMGTPYYAAPELLRCGTGDRRCDVYSLGVMLYEMLTGQLPLGRFAPPSQVAAAAPRALDGVVSRCLESDPALRFPDAAALRAAVDASCRAHRPRWMPAAAAAALLTAAALVLLAITRPWQRDADSRSTAARPESNVETGQAQLEPVAGQPAGDQQADADDGDERHEPDEQAAVPAAAPWLALSNVVIRSGQGPALSITFDCRRDPDRGLAADPDDFELLWVVESASGRRQETPLAPFGRASSQAVEGSMLIEPYDRWPMDVYMERVDSSAPTGRSRASNLVRVEQPEFPSLFRPFGPSFR